MSLVLDASAACELLLAGTGAHATAEAMERHDHLISAPHLIDLEVLSVLRKKVSAKEMSTLRAEQAIADLGDLPVARYPHEPFAARIWELRTNLTPYDAAYVALAEAFADAELLTADRRFARAARRRSGVSVRLVPA
jgi:predicted nucleic acid-binding protein